jgi:hypothetical protein
VLNQGDTLLVMLTTIPADYWVAGALLPMDPTQVAPAEAAAPSPPVVSIDVGPVLYMPEGTVP